MVGTGLRVDECLNLHFEDIKMIDRQKTKSIIEKEIKLNEYKKFLKDIGYLRDEGPDFKIETKNVDLLPRRSG